MRLPIPVTAAQLNLLPLAQFRSLFATLQVPDPSALPGIYQAAFVGPVWLCASAGPALALSGLGGWWGKEFLSENRAVNIVRRGGQPVNLFPMQLTSCPSLIDRQPGLTLRYQPGSPFPWMYIIDELRRLDADALLGMTIANLPGLRGLAFPFLLQRVDQR